MNAKAVFKEFWKLLKIGCC